MCPSLLAGIDDSDVATVAATADRLAEALGLSLVLAHIVEEPTWCPDLNAAWRKRRHHRVTQAATQVLEAARQETADAEQRLLHGAPVSTLLRAARDEDAALMVVGCRGHGVLNAAMFGSVSRALVSSGELPIVVVPPDAHPRERRLEGDHGFRPAVVCGIGPVDHADEHVAAAAVLCERSGFDLVLVHVVPETLVSASMPPAAAEAGLRHDSWTTNEQPTLGAEALERAVRTAITAAPGGDLTVRARVEIGDPVEELERVAAIVDAELLVVGSRGLGLVATALQESTSQRLSTAGKRATMIVPEGVTLDLQPPRSPRPRPRMAAVDANA